MAGAMVIVNTMVLVRAGFGLGAAELGWTLAAYGAGSMVARRFGAAAGMGATFLVLAALGAVGLLAAVVLWPRDDAEEVEHVHVRLPPGHEHLSDAHPNAIGALRHRQAS
jgi:hypothetical protein